MSSFRSYPAPNNTSYVLFQSIEVTPTRGVQPCYRRKNTEKILPGYDVIILSGDDFYGGQYDSMRGSVSQVKDGMARVCFKKEDIVKLGTRAYLLSLDVPVEHVFRL